MEDTYRDLHSWLFDKSEKEKEIEEKIDQEYDRFDSHPAHQEHREKLQKLFDELKIAKSERVAEGKKHRKPRKGISIPERTPEELAERKQKRYDELPEELKELITKYNSLSKKEKLEFEYFREHPYRNENDELTEYENPVTTHKDIRDLQDILVQDVIDFINEKGLTDIEAVGFGADGLQASAKEGEWSPSTDSSITVEGLQPMKDDKYNWPVRKIIGKSF